jgi:hypothetical protein
MSTAAAINTTGTIASSPSMLRNPFRIRAHPRMKTCALSSAWSSIVYVRRSGCNRSAPLDLVACGPKPGSRKHEARKDDLYLLFAFTVS